MFGRFFSLPINNGIILTYNIMNESASSDFRDTPPPPRIETLRTPHGEVSYSPERGGIITSIKLPKGDSGQLIELLYMDIATFNDREKNIKGGIPILFPNAGPIDHPDFPGLKQHGFARDSSNWTMEQGPNEFSETLSSDDESRKVYPFDHSLRLSGIIGEDGSLALSQSVTNLEQDRDLPVSMGLHPYFPVPHEMIKDIKFQFPGGDAIEQSVEQWAIDGTINTIKIDNPKFNDPEVVIRVKIPELGTLVIDASPEYQKIWIWSMPGKDFICIEPVMRNAGGLVDDPELVKPSKTYTGTVKFRLE